MKNKIYRHNKNVLTDIYDVCSCGSPHLMNWFFQNCMGTGQSVCFAFFMCIQIGLSVLETGPGLASWLICHWVLQECIWYMLYYLLCLLELIIFLVDISGDIIKTLKENGNEYTWGSVTVKLAEAYGFCWGVERAVQIAYEARKQFPDDKIWITNEIIHNPTVNRVSYQIIYMCWLFVHWWSWLEPLSTVGLGFLWSFWYDYE